MTTVTIVLRGGMIHRDSLGNKQSFGATTYNGKHTQWLSFGKGLIHELMWNNDAPSSKGIIIHQEIYQIWIDLPQSQRYMEPRIELLGGEDETPTVRDTRKDIQTTIIAGSYDGTSTSVDTISDLSILRVEMNKPYERWTYAPPPTHSTIIIYVRTGSIMIGNTRVAAHCTAYISSPSLSEEDKKKVIHITSGKDGADFLVLAGEPLKQRVTARGSMVVETPKELEHAYIDYENGEMGVPWSEKLTDLEWRRHLRQTQGQRSRSLLKKK